MSIISCRFCRTQFDKGFTLIELLVIIAIAGALAAGIFTFLNPLKRLNQGIDAKVKNDIGEIGGASQAYYTIMQYYPSDLQSLVDNGDLKTIPKTPGGADYDINPKPDGCTTTCLSVSVYTQMKDPQFGAGNVWCWKSLTAKAREMTPSDCTDPDIP